ncbi:hypothetical protein PanWU01x14_327130, partial [Parasponia andersonii]
SPLVFLVPKLQEHVHKIIQILSVAEKPIDPQQSSRPQNPIPIKQHEIHQQQVYPAIEKPGSMNQIHGVIKERKPLVQCNIERNQASECNHLIERSSNVESSCDDCDILFSHPCCKTPCANSKVQTNPYLPMLNGQNIIDQEINRE